MPIGAKVTLRGARMWEFLDRLISIALPRIRDFRGLSPESFDGRGNYSLGIREQIIFPEIDYDWSRRSAASTSPSPPRRPTTQARALLRGLGLPFGVEQKEELLDGQEVPGRQGRPAAVQDRAYSRCNRCGRPRSVYKKFGLCRICLRELAHAGVIPGMTKSSW